MELLSGSHCNLCVTTTTCTMPPHRHTTQRPSSLLLASPLYTTLAYQSHKSQNGMADLSVEDKCKLAAKLLEQAPPGEVK
jgi:hypothetical protein